MIEDHMDEEVGLGSDSDGEGEHDKMKNLKEILALKKKIKDMEKAEKQRETKDPEKGEDGDDNDDNKDDDDGDDDDDDKKDGPAEDWIESTKDILLTSNLNVLLLLIPFAILGKYSGMGDGWLFVLALLPIC